MVIAKSAAAKKAAAKKATAKKAPAKKAPAKSATTKGAANSGDASSLLTQPIGSLSIEQLIEAKLLEKSKKNPGDGFEVKVALTSTDILGIADALAKKTPSE